MNDRTLAIFISYASQDAAAAQRICEALRAGGLDVWFDQSELRGGDAWDASIRRQIRDCALFMPVISLHTQEREEGYFRREWNLAVSRTLDMAHDRAFLLPVVIDGTTDINARVPEKFRELQWTRLPGGETSAAFVEHVRRILSARGTLPSPPADSTHPAAGSTSRRESAHPPGATAPAHRRIGWVGINIAVTLIIMGGLLFWHERKKVPALAALPSAQAPESAGFVPPPHSIAVLPFVNLSGDPKQDYFSDGLSEELLNSLATVHDLQVAARTSSFSFKGTNTKLTDIAHELNVGALLEGSVRKEGNHVRITAELINTVTGFNQWSHTYDRDLKNILSLQTEIASAVTKALQAALLPGTTATFELGGTNDAQAFDAYLQGEKLEGRGDAASLQAQIAYFDEAIRLDPGFAKAYVGKSYAQAHYAGQFDVSKFPQAQATAEKAVALAPELGSAHTALGDALDSQLDFGHALAEHERALQLSPGDSFVLQNSGDSLIYLGRAEGIEAARRAAMLDPLNGLVQEHLGAALYMAHDYQGAAEALDRATKLDPALDEVTAFRGVAYYRLGKLDLAVKSCQTPPINVNNRMCLAIVYQKQGRIPEAQAALKQIFATDGDKAAYQIAAVYASWGDTDHAINWLQTALRLRDPGLLVLKIDPQLDSVRSDPRFQSIERELKFPD